MGLFDSSLWGTSVKVTPLLALMFTKEGRPALTRVEQCVFVVGSDAAKKAKQNCMFTLSLKELEKLTGYEKTRIRAALRSLAEKKFLRAVGGTKHGETRTFEVSNPLTGDGLSSQHTDRTKWQNLRGAMQSEPQPLAYFDFPTESIMTLPEKDAAVFSLLLAVARTAGRLRKRCFEMSAAELRSQAGLDFKTFKAAIAGADERWFAIGFKDDRRRDVFVVLYDPASGQSLDDVEELRKDSEQKQREQRYAENAKRTDYHTNVKLMALALWALGDLEPHGGYGEFVRMCPLCHNTKKHKPRFSVNVFKNSHGVWVCPECKKGGDLRVLIENLTGIDKLKVQQKLANISSEHPELIAKANKMLKNYDADGRYKAA